VESRYRGGSGDASGSAAAMAAAEWDSRSEASPTGDWPPVAAASPVKGKAAMPDSDAGASASGSSEAKVDDGNIQEAESSLREGLSLNYEVSKSLCPLPLVLGLIWVHESSYFWRGLGEMGGGKMESLW
jgi:hypothetical protein